MSRPRVAIAAWAIILTATAAFAADPVKIGPEIVVAGEYARDAPRVASDAAGNFIVAWEDDDSAAKARRWFATGAEFVPEFQVSTPTQYLGTSSSTSTGNLGVAGDSAGNFMVTFNAFDYAYDAEEESICGDPCLFTRRSDANGALGPQFLIQDPTTTYVYEAVEDDQVSNPEIAALGNGDFVVAWEGYDLVPYPDDPESFSSDESAFAAKTSAIGQKKGSYFRVNTIAEEYQGQYGELSVSGDAAGNFVVLFRSEYDYDFPGGTIHGQLYDDKGKRVGTEFGLSSESSDGHTPDVARAAGGTFLAIWSSSDLGLTGRVFDGGGGPVTDDFAIFSGGAYYAAVAASDESFVVVWEDDGTILGQRFDLLGDPLTTQFAVSTDPDAYSPDVAAAANGDFVAVWKNDDGEPRAQRFQVETPVEQEIGVFGKNIAITNKVPDDPEKNKITWNAGGTNIVVPPRGTSSDPRCNGDPPGTVKATIEFSSPTSGHGSGVLPLPCENWFALGGTAVDQVETRSYRYVDGQLDEGPCSSILIVGKKNIAVKCKGSGAATDLPYDLVPGTSEGTVHAVLDMGLYKFCSSFPPAGSADGSDGKKFKGKNAPIAPCP